VAAHYTLDTDHLGSTTRTKLLLFIAFVGGWAMTGLMLVVFAGCGLRMYRDHAFVHRASPQLRIEDWSEVRPGLSVHRQGGRSSMVSMRHASSAASA
jgi:hypothetical protein